MSHSDDVFWRQMCALDDPTPEEMARAEAALSEEGVVAPLAEGEVERLIGRTVGSARGGAVPRTGSAKGWWLLAAGVVFVSATTLMLWPERRDSDLTLPYANAIVLAGEIGYDDEARVSALSIIGEECGGAGSALLQLARDGDGRVAAAAVQAKARILELFGVPVSAPAISELPGRGALQLMADATAPSLNIEARLLLVDEVEQFLSAGVRALRTCYVTTPVGLANRDLGLKLLQRRLTQ